MVVDGCQQSSELLVLSGRPEGDCILFRIEPAAMVQCHTITVGQCFVRVIVTSVSNAFRKPQEMLIAHRLDYSGSERTDSYATPACTVASEPRVAIKLNRRHE